MERKWEELATGASGNTELERAWLRKAKEIFDIFCLMQKSYGPDNIAMTREKGVTIRINDKIQRLLNLHLADKPNPLEDETLRDTIIDIGDYAIIWLLCADKDWPEYVEKPTEFDQSGGRPVVRPPRDFVKDFILGAIFGTLGCIIGVLAATFGVLG